MADITPIASLNGELAMPEKVWMQGPPGPQGQQGEPGAAATVTVGTVTTGEPGTDAIVTNSGTESAAVLDFTIPRGETGAVGAAGADGVSPTVSTSKSGNVTTITIVDSSGTKTATINDGAKGDTGPAGPAGAGVPDGGTVGQLLSKTESGTAWIDPPQSGGATTLHINVTAVNRETMEATFTADKTPTEMQQASANGPTWCVVTFEAGVMSANAVSIGLPPVWFGGFPAFGGLTALVHNADGNNTFSYAVREATSDRWLVDVTQFGGQLDCCNRGNIVDGKYDSGTISVIEVT